MKLQGSIRRIVLIAAGFLLLAAAVSALAIASYEIGWFSLDNGGGTSSGGAYALGGTLGQWDAAALSSGGSFALSGGFVTGADATLNGAQSWALYE